MGFKMQEKLPPWKLRFPSAAFGLLGDFSVSCGYGFHVHVSFWPESEKNNFEAMKINTCLTIKYRNGSQGPTVSAPPSEMEISLEIPI